MPLSCMVDSFIAVLLLLYCCLDWCSNSLPDSAVPLCIFESSVSARMQWNQSWALVALKVTKSSQNLPLLPYSLYPALGSL
ncbi:expressed protein, partial [Phakopsora pachyrhizi]